MSLGCSLPGASLAPKSWQFTRLGELATFVTSGSRGWARFYTKAGALFIRSQNVRDGRLRFDDVQYVSPPAGAEGDRTKVKRHDLLITITGNSVGNVALVEENFAEAYISQHVGLVRLKEPAAAPYICRYLSPFSPGNAQIFLSQSGQSKPGLSLQNLRDLLIASPPTARERDDIAETLSDADALLGALDRLIAKKRDLKQAAMQQLLTGQTRLSGCDGEWEVKRLGDLGRFFKGRGVNRDQAQSGSLPCIRYGEIYTVHENVIRSFSSWISADVAAEATLLRCGDILFAGSGETKEEIGKCVAFVGKYEAYAGGDIVILRPSLENPKFLGYLLNTTPIVRQKANLGQGDAIVHISAAALSSIQISLPNAAEQKAIAAVLSDMDAELEALDQYRAKTATLKQGMMQELLTGRTRLV